MFKPLDTNLSNSGLRRRATKVANVTTPSVLILESIDRANPLEGKGRLWVKNDTPNVMVFTNDVGQDSILGSLSLRENGVELGEFSSLDFIGSGISATDGGGGEADIDISSTSSININLNGVFDNTTDNGLDFATDELTITDGGGQADITFNPTIFIHDETINIGFYNTLNFIGSSVNVTDGGSGIADLTFTQNIPTLDEVLTVGNSAGGDDITNVDTVTFQNSIRVGSTFSTVTPSFSNCIALGRNANAFGNGSIAIGRDCVSSGSDSIAIGRSANSNQIYSMAIGETAQSTGQYAIGIRGSGTGLRSIGIKGGATNTEAISVWGGTASGVNSVNIGPSGSASGSNSFVLSQGSIATDAYSYTFYTNGDTRTDYESVFHRFRYINRDVLTTDTTLTNAITFTLNATEVFSVDCIVKEINTEGLDHSIIYTLRDYHFRRIAGGTASVNPGSTTTSNPDGVTLSTVTLGVSGNDMVLDLTADDNDDRTWKVSMTIYCCDDT